MKVESEPGRGTTVTLCFENVRNGGAEKFLAYSSSKEPAYIEYSATISEELLYENVLQLVQELSLLLDENCKVVLEELLVSYKEAHGFTVQFIYGDDYWDVGFLDDLYQSRERIWGVSEIEVD